MSVAVEIPRDMLEGIVAFFRAYRRYEALEAGWRDRAACGWRDVPPLRWFYPDVTHLLVGARQLRRARRVCARCPVRRPCLELAIVEDKEGVWAGTTHPERKEVADLPLTDQLDVLEERFAEVATTGPWRVVSAQELVEAVVASAA